MKYSAEFLLQHEIGTIRKSHSGKLKIALIYPNTYTVGMSNLAVHTLYRQLNARKEIVCERVFFEQNPPDVPRSLESGTKLTGFDLLACSLSFELDYLNLIRLLRQANIPVFRKDRREKFPILIAGGIAISANPEPLADIIDAIVLGEAEEIIEPILALFIASNGNKSAILTALSEVSGIYVPQLLDSAENLTRLHIKELDRYPTVSQIITPYTEFKNMFLIELGRGCPSRCRFCLAGCFYNPVRYHSLDHIREQLEKAKRLTLSSSYPRIGIIATAIADYPNLEEFCEEMLRKNIAVSFASLRADKAPVHLLKLLKQSGQKTVTFAPEAGSESLRTAIGKPISDNHLVDMVERSVALGMLNVKLYFMVGLPQETEADIIALINLSRRLRDALLSASKKLGRAGKLIISINPFIPKKGTPFETEPMVPLPELNKQITLIRARLRKENNLKLQIANPKLAGLEAELSLGGRELGKQLSDLPFQPF
ncbi:MAG: radical SAM protein [bacterium]|nr:radical SAM protein [bacterium]